MPKYLYVSFIVILTSFSKKFLEKTDKLGVIGLDVNWDDIGTWDIVEKYLPKLGNNKNQIELYGSGNKIKLKNQTLQMFFCVIKHKINLVN